MSFGLTSQWKTPCLFLRLLPKAQRTCLKHDPRCQLNRSQPACPEYLGSACARQPIVWLVQHTAEASKIGDVETPLQLRRARPELLHSVENLSTRSWKLTLELSPTRSVRRRPTVSSPGLETVVPRLQGLNRKGAVCFSGYLAGQARFRVANSHARANNDPIRSICNQKTNCCRRACPRAVPDAIYQPNEYRITGTSAPDLLS